MIYQPSDPYGRSRYNPLALRAMVIDKLRERLLGLMFVPDEAAARGPAVTLDDILAGRVKGQALRRLSAELGRQPGSRPTWPPATRRCARPWRSCRRSWTRRARPWT